MIQDKLPIGRKILFSLGSTGFYAPAFFLSTYLFIFYAPTAKGSVVIVSSLLVGVAYFVGTLIQAVANPFIGNWSDKASYKIGRRRFFIVTGLAPLALFFFLIWVPFFSSINQFILLLIDMVGYNFFFAYVVLPYLALIPELSVTVKDRVRLTTIMGYFSILGLVLASLIPLVLLSVGFGFNTVGGVMTAILLVTFLIVYATTEERVDDAKKPAAMSFIDAVVQTFKNHTFNRYIVAYLFFQFGFYFILSAIGYMVEDLVFPNLPSTSSQAYVGLVTLMAVIFTVLSSPILIKYTDKRGEKKSFILFTSILSLSFFLMPLVGILPVSIRFWSLIPILLVTGLGLTSYFILPNAILSEIIDEDEENTGFRREAMYFGVQGFLERVPSALAGFILGVWIHFLYRPTSDPVYIMLLGVVAGASTLATAILFLRVPLKEKSREISGSETG
ncbi:MAG: MFS transporter [Candidatus Thermoplasmatota archaeon]|jgi:GPH family glycoside/pentoside/hexuronide:cation symporter|nr:MFS transporter [Candidatus Thermoplasmatota archaeon]MCL5785255.1 MFS transporter [Candidatus Thermoplasmatota archaeon]